MLCTYVAAHTPPRVAGHRKRRRLACRCEAMQVAVVGAGAAGLTAAYFAAAEGADVVLLEKNSEAGRKILISGGTRCNVLPLQVDAQRDYFTESSQSALRAVLSNWTLEECHTWLSHPEKLGIPLALELETNKYFPVSNSAVHVRDSLVAACQRRGVVVRYGAGLQGLRRRGPEGGWVCEVEGGGEVAADRVVLATGGKSFPKLGTEGVGYRVARELGHTLCPPYPALTPLLGTHPGAQQLAGVSLYGVELTCLQPPQLQVHAQGGTSAAGEAAAAAAAAAGAAGAGAVATGGGRRGGRQQAQRAVRSQRSAMLFTHRGYSGPAVLDLSSYVIKALERGEAPPELVVDWTGEGRAAWEQRLAGKGMGGVAGVLRKHGLPQRLAEALCMEAGVPLDRKLAELKKGEREGLLAVLSRYPLPVSGHEGYGKAEVTGGGVPLNQVNCASLESRQAEGVYLCGELLDVFGRIGGFNFYWAWVTGRAAGVAAARR